jgi:hypothetical protein
MMIADGSLSIAISSLICRESVNTHDGLMLSISWTWDGADLSIDLRHRNEIIEPGLSCRFLPEKPLICSGVAEPASHGKQGIMLARPCALQRLEPVDETVWISRHLGRCWKDFTSQFIEEHALKLQHACIVLEFGLPSPAREMRLQPIAIPAGDCLLRRIIQ